MSSMDGLATPGRDPDRLQSPVVAGDVPMTDSDIPRVPGEAPAPLPEGSHQHVVPEPFGEADLPPGAPEDLLGRRIAAALIDLVLLTGLGLVLGLTVGEYSFAPGGFSVSLSGAWFLAYVVLALLYYFAVEATTSQTVGKRLVGLRVLRADGSRPSVGAIAGRTLLRIVDWLPLLYLIGFIVMLTTRSRRLRMGDLAANTAVRRAVPGQRRGLAGVSLVVVLAAAVGLTAYRAGSVAGTKIYQGHGIRFEYPGGWDEIGLGTLASGGDAEDDLWQVGVGVGRYDLVEVHAYRMRVPVGREQMQEAMTAFTQSVQRLYEQQGGSLQEGPEQVTIGGKPGFRFLGTLTVDGAQIKRTDMFFFDGTTEYHLGCQSTTARAAEVGRACNQVQRSFTLTAGATTTR